MRAVSFIRLVHEIRVVKFIYSEKATIFFEISSVDLSSVVPVKSTDFVAFSKEPSLGSLAFSEYMNFTFNFFNFFQKGTTRGLRLGNSLMHQLNTGSILYLKRSSISALSYPTSPGCWLNKIKAP